MSKVDFSVGEAVLHRWAVADVLTLNVATGVVEAVCLAHLGGLFAAYVTGTVVLAGVRLGAGGIAALLPYAVAFLGFITGGLAGGAIVQERRPRPGAYVGALMVEVGVLAVAAWACTFVTPGSELPRLAALALLAFAMAVQFSATRSRNVTSLRFAAATGLVHGLVHDTASGHGVPKQLVRRLLALVTLLAGAAVGALIALWSVPAAVAVAALIVLLSAMSTIASRRLAR